MPKKNGSDADRSHGNRQWVRGSAGTRHPAPGARHPGAQLPVCDVALMTTEVEVDGDGGRGRVVTVVEVTVVEATGVEVVEVDWSNLSNARVSCA